MRTPEEINAVIQKLETRLTEPEMDLPVNSSIKEGFKKAIELINRGETQYNGVGALISPQSRAIAVIACDWLNNFVEYPNLTEIPIKN